jgi:hypothetical protein
MKMQAKELVCGLKICQNLNLLGFTLRELLTANQDGVTRPIVDKISFHHLKIEQNYEAKPIPELLKQWQSNGEYL